MYAVLTSEMARKLLTCLTMEILGPTSLTRYMDLLSARQKVVASNIANIDTPGYKTRDIDFASELQDVESTTQPRVIEAPGLAIKNDGNNVSLDREMRLLSENGLRFNIASAFMKDEIGEIRKAIQGE